MDLLSWAPKFFFQTLTLYPDLSFHLECPFHPCMPSQTLLSFFLFNYHLLNSYHEPWIMQEALTNTVFSL